MTQALLSGLYELLLVLVGFSLGGLFFYARRSSRIQAWTSVIHDKLIDNWSKGEINLQELESQLEAVDKIIKEVV